MNKKGFTLVEVIIVLVIMVIIAALAVPSIVQYSDHANASNDRIVTDALKSELISAVSAKRFEVYDVSKLADDEEDKDAIDIHKYVNKAIKNVIDNHTKESVTVTMESKTVAVNKEAKTKFSVQSNSICSGSCKISWTFTDIEDNMKSSDIEFEIDCSGAETVKFSTSCAYFMTPITAPIIIEASGKLTETYLSHVKNTNKVSSLMEILRNDATFLEYLDETDFINLQKALTDHTNGKNPNGNINKGNEKEAWMDFYNNYLNFQVTIDNADYTVHITDMNNGVSYVAGDYSGENGKYVAKYTYSIENETPQWKPISNN